MLDIILIFKYHFCVQIFLYTLNIIFVFKYNSSPASTLESRGKIAQISISSYINLKGRN